MWPFKTNWKPVASPLLSKHAAACAAIHSKCFAHSWPASELETMIASVNYLADGVFHEPDGQVLGFSITRLVADEAEILTIAIDPRARQQGMGRQLLETQIGGLVRKGIRRIMLEVEDSNEAALKLYRSFNFHRDGVRKGYYAQGRIAPADAILLSCQL